MNEFANDVPTNLEARRRISFFTNSLFMDMPRPPRVRKMLSFRSDSFLLKNDSKMNIVVTLPSCKELPSHFVEFNLLITYSWSNDCLLPSCRLMDKWLEFDQILVIGSHIGLHLTRHCTTYVQSI